MNKLGRLGLIKCLAVFVLLAGNQELCAENTKCVFLRAVGRIGNNSTLWGNANGTHELALSGTNELWHHSEIAQHVWSSGRPEPFIIAYNAGAGLAVFSLGTCTITRLTREQMTSLTTLNVKLMAQRKSTRVQITELRLDGELLADEISKTGPGSTPSEWTWELQQPVTSFTLTGTAIFRFPEGPGCPNNDQLSFVITFAGMPVITNEDYIPLDADGDGIFDSWELEYFPTIRDCDPKNDTDDDGASNWHEYCAGTNPIDPNSCLRVSVSDQIPPKVVWSSVTGRVYSIWRATTLSDGMAGFSLLASGLTGSPPFNVFSDGTATNSSRYYYRISVRAAAEKDGRL